ncbi:MAG TPA: molecular chaperone DnaK, partial [Pseudoflavonifractor sp.]|nr:molecular chaperone DnaK [Pseudoflavonifractor sp.]
ADKSSLDSALEQVKTALKGTDVAAIKTATENLSKAFYPISEKLYSQAGGQAGAGPDMGGAGFTGDVGGGDPNVVDADYQVVDDDNQ